METQSQDYFNPSDLDEVFTELQRAQAKFHNTYSNFMVCFDEESEPTEVERRELIHSFQAVDALLFALRMMVDDVSK